MLWFRCQIHRQITEGPIKTRTVVSGISRYWDLTVGCFTRGHQNILKKCSHQSPTDFAKRIGIGEKILFKKLQRDFCLPYDYISVKGSG